MASVHLNLGTIINSYLLNFASFKVLDSWPICPDFSVWESKARKQAKTMKWKLEFVWTGIGELVILQKSDLIPIRKDVMLNRNGHGHVRKVTGFQMAHGGICTGDHG